MLVFIITHAAKRLRHVLVASGTTLDKSDVQDLTAAGWDISCQIATYKASTPGDVRTCVKELLER